MFVWVFCGWPFGRFVGRGVFLLVCWMACWLVGWGVCLFDDLLHNVRAGLLVGLLTEVFVRLLGGLSDTVRVRLLVSFVGCGSIWG